MIIGQRNPILERQALFKIYKAAYYNVYLRHNPMFVFQQGRLTLFTCRIGKLAAWYINK